ncbi:MAG: hypothetical protein HKP58_18310 [Desulfatitalea sp.]|nr:CsgG/HfaB family protein [Desulfatitalea sp.]NNK02370.1 hypothetical protein [Desulfatitalea sp.]
MKPSHLRILKCCLSCLWLFVMAGCAATGPATDDRPVAVAVWDLEDLSPAPHGKAGMGEFLAAQITATVGEMPNYEAVERVVLLKALEELNIGSSDLADDQTRLKLGRVIGARQMVFGAFQVAGTALRIDLRRVDVATGKIVSTASDSASADSLKGWLPAAGRAARELMAP